MRKRFMSILLTCALSVWLVACGNESTQQTGKTETIESAEQQTTEEPAASSEAEIIEQPTTEEPAESIAEPEPIAEPTALYTYTDLSATMYAQRSVNVRDLPSTDGNKLGGLSTNQEAAVTGQCNETGWYRIDYNGSVAYVSNNYLGESTVEVVQQTGSSNTSTSGEMSRNAADYRSVSSLSEISLVPGWDTDYEGFVSNCKNIEKVTYTHNGVTVLLYDYRMMTYYGTINGEEFYGEDVIYYDFTNFRPWCRTPLKDVDTQIDNGGSEYISAGVPGWNPISNYQVY